MKSKGTKFKVIQAPSWCPQAEKRIGQVGVCEKIKSGWNSDYDGLWLKFSDGEIVVFSRYELKVADA